MATDSGSQADALRTAAGTGASAVVTVDGRRLRLTNRGKMMYPHAGMTKGDVLAYYERVAPTMLPYLRDRPATRKRWVHGVGTAEHPEQAFFQKNLDRSTPDWVARRTQRHRDHSDDYPLVNDTATLLWCAQQAALELHVPQWRFGPRGGVLRPDRLVLDLDPGRGAGLEACAEVALLARERMRGHGLELLPVTSGGSGIHLYAALDGGRTDAGATRLARELARGLEAEHPRLVISTMAKRDRAGKVFVDWSQNRRAKTTVAPYSLRGRTRPTVAAPRSWDEVDAGGLTQLGPDEVLARLERDGDLLAPLLRG